MESLIKVTDGQEIHALEKLTAERLLKIYTPESTRLLQRKLNSVGDLIKHENNTPSFGWLRSKRSELLAIGILKYYLVDLVDYFNVSRTMDEKQIDQTADLILQEFPQLKIAQLIYTFKQAKLGKMGSIYEGIDGMKIIQWIRTVFDETCYAGECASISAHERFKDDLISVVGNERTLVGNGMKELIHMVNINQQLWNV